MQLSTAGLPGLRSLIVTAEPASIIEMGGRVFEGKWRPAATYATVNCVHEDHNQCHGWVNPARSPRRCVCPCHDSGRMPYLEAQAASEAVIAANRKWAAALR